ncbi:MAG: CPBP family glutamic-type intramembrane protease [Infirmifilum sp.]
MPKVYSSTWQPFALASIPAILGLLLYYYVQPNVATFYLFLIMAGFITGAMNPEAIGFTLRTYSKKGNIFQKSFVSLVSVGILVFFVSMVSVKLFQTTLLPSLPFASINALLLPSADLLSTLSQTIENAPVTSWLITNIKGSIVIYFIAFSEELAFRGPMFYWTTVYLDKTIGKKVGSIFADFISNFIWSALFAFFHLYREFLTSGATVFVLNADKFYILLLLGLIWGFTRLLTNSIIPTIVAHFSWDFLAMNNILLYLWR